jgi:hypothetical protein
VSRHRALLGPSSGRAQHPGAATSQTNRPFELSQVRAWRGACGGREARAASRAEVAACSQTESSRAAMCGERDRADSARGADVERYGLGIRVSLELRERPCLNTEMEVRGWLKSLRDPRARGARRGAAVLKEAARASTQQEGPGRAQRSEHGRLHPDTPQRGSSPATTPMARTVVLGHRGRPLRLPCTDLEPGARCVPAAGRLQVPVHAARRPMDPGARGSACRNDPLELAGAKSDPVSGSERADRGHHQQRQRWRHRCCDPVDTRCRRGANPREAPVDGDGRYGRGDRGRHCEASGTSTRRSHHRCGKPGEMGFRDVDLGPASKADEAISEIAGGRRLHGARQSVLYVRARTKQVAHWGLGMHCLSRNVSESRLLAILIARRSIV